MSDFSASLIVWQREHGRNGLPWQVTDPYRVWLSEIMLQQTQVATVIPYFQRFTESFPDITALASASEEQVLEHWSGLGYYARGRNLHRAALIIMAKHGGVFPREFDQIIELPGIGRSTAAAICALAFHESRAILDGNVRRVLARYCGITGWTGDKKVEALLWQHAEALLPPPCRGRVGEGVGMLSTSTPILAFPLKRGRNVSVENIQPEDNVAIYTQALMDMGAMLCTRSKPKCTVCPVQGDCVAFHTGRVAELPTPRPRKAVPERSVTFLLAMHGNDILLEKRGPSGIWGGLWCLPQLEEGDEELVEYAQGWKINEQIALPVFIHTFTHFKLHITPLRLNLAHKPLQVQQAGGVWMGVEDALSAAIPTPVRRLLEQL